MKKSHNFLAIALVAILFSGITAFVVTKINTPKGSKNAFGHAEPFGAGGNLHLTSTAAGGYVDLTEAAESSVKAVVSIEKIEEVASGFGSNPILELFGIPQQQGQALRERRSGGSGVIISEDGYIVTNNHVIDNAKKLKIKLNDNRVFEGRIVGSDPTTDIALIKIEAEELPFLEFGNSDALRLGEWVLAVGSPFDLQWTVTAGIVSAKARNLSVIPSQFRIESFIQTDAAINPGSSGGALVNARGELVGINTVIKSPTGSYAGYSFAVPTSIVHKVVTDLREYGVVQRAMIGISFQEINADFVEKFGQESGVSEIGGIYVSEVDPVGGAAASGIKKGDIIFEVDGVPIDGAAALLEQVAKHRPNDKIEIKIKREGKVKQFNVTLRNKAGKAELLSSDYVDVVDALKGSFAEVSDQQKKKLNIKGGAVVAAVEQGGVLSKVRIKRGFIITDINGQKINSVGDISRVSSKITSIEGVYPDGGAASYTIVDSAE